MKISKLFCLLFLGLLTLNIYANVTLSGTSKSYAGETISFYKYHNQITYEEKLLGETVIDTSGKFTVEIEISEPTYVFTHLGVYFAYIFAEPGKKYELILPERQDKTMEDKMNPYFNETHVQLSTLGVVEDELNFSIRMFNNSFAAYYGKYVLDQYEQKTFENLESDIERLEKAFKKSDNEFFNNYRQYKYGFLQHSAFQQLSKKSYTQYFSDKPVLYENTAYNDFFNQLFNQYFQYLGRTAKGKVVYENINTQKSLSNLIKTLQKENNINSRQLLEYVILKNIHDECYDDKFSRSALLEILDELIATTEFEKHKEIGKQIKQKVTKLLVGYHPPEFELYDQDSNLISLNELKGKYIYLNFCTANSYACLSEYEMLRSFKEKHAAYLTIITISADESYTEMKEFVDKRGYNWQFLYFGNQPEVLKDYDIRAFPTYYLIDKEGKLAMSPATSPRENFEQQLFKVLRGNGDI